ncbi:MAG: acetyl-CoA hydrolase/transferase C-terminal domain-containing protein [Oscillospiraceae bacterium]
MADWKAYYKEHLVTVEEAAKQIKPGDCVWIGQASEMPVEVLDEMHAHQEDYHDIKIQWNCANAPFDFLFDPTSKEHVRLQGYFGLPLERISSEMGIFEYLGCNYDFFNKCPDVHGMNTLMVRVCPPDEDGFCNYGTYGVCTTSPIAKHPNITKKIGIIDRTGNFPVLGDRDIVAINVTEFDYIVECDSEFMEVPAPQATDVDVAVAAYIAPFINEGDRVEIGWGGLGEEILRNLKDKGIKFEVYSEVACDSTLPLLKEGIITHITSVAPGACSEEFMRQIGFDDRITLVTQMTGIHPFSIAQVENIVAINSTFMIDLIGQCCSEAQGLVPYSGAGGSFSYIYGATQAKGGRSFICLRSTYKVDGVLHSNVVPWLPEGSIVTTPKNFVMYLVSEWGVADVYLKSLKDRIRTIIEIAHPDFRAELKEKICSTPLISEEDFDILATYDHK